MRKTVRERLKEPRAGLKAPMPYVSAALALAFIPEDGDVDEIGRLLLLDDIETTSIVLILKALDIAGDPAGVKYVREFRARNKDNQFEIPLWGCDQQWKTSLRFAVELRAVKTLVKLGCCEENAILDSYVNHENLLILQICSSARGHVLLVPSGIAARNPRIDLQTVSEHGNGQKER